jgi:DNA-3-methyladenine glycosylase I
MQKTNNKIRCPWPGDDYLMVTYHDEEWGVPVHKDKKHFEYFLLDSFQAGLSWSTILKKRENFRKAFDNFDYRKIAKYTQKDTNRLLSDEGIIRNKLKVAAAITNARKFLDIQREFGSFDKYIWQFVGGLAAKNKFKNLSEIPAKTEESDAMTKDLKSRGFKFVGSTICYAYMQGSGLVNDHVTSCFRYREL